MAKGSPFTLGTLGGIDQDKDRDASSPDSDQRTKGPLDQARGPLKLRLQGNKRAGDVSPKVRSRRKSRSFRVR